LPDAPTRKRLRWFFPRCFMVLAPARRSRSAPPVLDGPPFSCGLSSRRGILACFKSASGMNRPHSFTPRRRSPPRLKPESASPMRVVEWVDLTRITSFCVDMDWTSSANSRHARLCCALARFSGCPRGAHERRGSPVHDRAGLWGERARAAPSILVTGEGRPNQPPNPHTTHSSRAPPTRVAPSPAAATSPSSGDGGAASRGSTPRVACRLHRRERGSQHEVDSKRPTPP
jgi:hypothetical protein